MSRAVRWAVIALVIVLGSLVVFCCSLFLWPWQNPPAPNLPAPASTTAR